MSPVTVSFGTVDMTSSDGLLSRGTHDDVSILAPKEKPKRPEPKAVQYRAPQELIDEVDAAAAEAGISRNEAITQFLKFALAEHRKGRRTKR
jgi:hypothetical protein